MFTEDDASNQMRLFLPCTFFVWLVVFLAMIFEGHDYTDDGQFTISDVTYVAYDISAGWIERRILEKPCIAKTAIERFFETNRCEFVGTLKWPLGLMLYFCVGSALAWFLIALGKLIGRVM